MNVLNKIYIYTSFAKSLITLKWFSFTFHLNTASAVVNHSPKHSVKMNDIKKGPIVISLQFH